MENDKALHLNPRRQMLKQDAEGHNHWQVVMTPKTLPAAESALLICDMWDKHWSRGATERVDAMAPRMNTVIDLFGSRGWDFSGGTGSARRAILP